MKTFNTTDHDHRRLKQRLWIIEAIIFIVCLLFVHASSAQNVTVPDANFKAYLVGNTEINTNLDGEIQVSEAEAFTGRINCNSQSISDLTGIEAFVNLTELLIGSNNLSTVDISNNTQLTNFFANSNSFTTLDLSANTQLQILSLWGNELASLDVSNNINLQELTCANNPGITTLDLSQNNALINLDASETGITSIDLSNNTLLQTVSITDNNLGSIDVTPLTALEELYVYSTLIESIDLTQNPNLVYLDIEYNQLSEIDISQNTLLEEAILNGNTPLSHLNAANGNNENLYLEVDTSPNLTCIQVSNVAYADANWTKDATASFSLDCPGPFELVSLTPANGALDASKESVLTLTFSHDADIGAGNIRVYKVSDDALVAQLNNFNGTYMTIDGPSITFDFPVDFPQGEELYVQVSDAYLRSDEISEDWEGIQDNTSWTFTVEDTRPQIISFSPTTEIAPANLELSLTYDREMALTTSSIPALRIYNSDDTQVFFANKNSSYIELDGATATISLPNPLPSGTDYYVTLDEGLFVDAMDLANGGQDIDDDQTWVFSTRVNDGNGPDILSLSPANGATKVERAGNAVDFEITFDEPVFLGNTSGAVRLYREEGETDALYYNIGNLASISEDNLTVTFNIPGNYNMFANTEHYILLDETNGSNGVIFDADGNNVSAIVGENDWRFTTYGPVEILSTSPTDDAVDVGTDGVVSFTTNNNITVGTGTSIYLRYSSNNANAAVVTTDSEEVTLDGDEVTVDFGELATNTSYYVYIPNNAFRDEFNQTFTIAGSDTWNFTTGDDIAPELISQNPLHQSTDVATSTDLILTFNEDIQAGSGNIEIKRFSDDQLLQSISISAPEVSISGATATIDTEDFDTNTEMYVEIASGVLEDLAGNDFEGILKPDWSFTTELGDITPPSLVSLDPANEATDVPLDINYTMTFDEDIQAGTGNILIKRVSDDVQVGFRNVEYVVTVTGNELSFSGITGSIYHNTAFYIEVPSGAIEDLNGNSYPGFTGNTSWSFTTEDLEPHIVSLSPADGSTDVAASSNFVLEFDKDVVADNGLISFKRLSDDQSVLNFNVTGPEVSISGSTVTLNPGSDLPYDTDLYIQFPFTTFRSPEGVAAQAFEAGDWNFTTEAEPDNDPPAFTSLAPLDDAIDVSITTNLEITFDENVFSTNHPINVIRIVDFDTDQSIEVFDPDENGNGRVTITGNVLTLNPTNDLLYDKQYYVIFNEDILQDESGNILAGYNNNFTWNFTTESDPDVTQPSVTAFSPSHQSTDVSIDVGQLQITFDEDIQKTNPGNIILRDFDNNIAAQYYPAIDDPNASVSGNVLTLNLPSDLAYETSYYVQFLSGTVADLAGNNFAGFNNASTWIFTTASEPDETSPNLATLSPADDAINVTIDQSLMITFDEDIMIATSGATKQAVIKYGSNQLFEVVSLTNDHIDGNVLTIPHADFERETTYYLYLADGVIADLSNNWFSGIIETTEWDFTTESKLDQAITFESIADQVYGDDSFQISASSNSGLGVELSIVEGPITLNGNEVTITGAGTAVIAANQLGDDTYNAAQEVTQSFQIAKANQTITISTVDDKLISDDPFEVAATVDSGLELTYSVSGPASNQGSTITLTGEAGTVTVTVSQDGTDNYNSASASMSFEVIDPSKQDQSITFNEIADKVFGDDPFQITTTSSSGLAVTLSVVNGPISLSGNEVTITGAGTATIAANQPGNDSFNPALEVTQSFEITKADQVITITPIGDKLTTDSSFDIEAEVDSGLELTYSVSGPASNNGSTVTLTGESGNVTVTVSQAGTDNYNSATATESFDVSDPAKQSQSITFSNIEDKVFGDDSFQMSASSSSGLAVTFTVVEGPITLDGHTVSITGAGEATIAANQEGDDTFNAAEQVTQSFLITKADQAITITPIGDKLTTDVSFNIQAEVDSGLELAYDISGPATNIGSTITLTGETGTVTVTVSQAGNENYNSATAAESFEVSDPAKQDQIITFNEIDDKVYGDDAFEISATSNSNLDVTFTVLDGPIALDGNTVSIIGAGTATIAANQAGDDTYHPALEVTQTFEIAKADQIISITPIADKFISDEPFEVQVSVDSELELTYEVAGPATNQGSTVTLTGETGTVTITVSQAGNDNYNSTSASESFEVTEDVLGLEQGIHFEFYPNPVFHQLTVKTSESSTIRILGLDGRVHLVQHNKGHVSLDLYSLKPGVYVLEIRFDDQITREQIIKAN